MLINPDQPAGQQQNTILKGASYEKQIHRSRSFSQLQRRD